MNQSPIQANSSNTESSNVTITKKSRKITLIDVKETYKYLVKTNRRYVNNTKEKKEQGLHNDYKDIDRLFNLLYEKYNIVDLMDMYRYPEKYIEHTKGNKKFLNMLYVLWNNSKNKNYKEGEVPESVIKLATRIESISSFNMQHGLLKEKSKQRQTANKETNSYYDWNDIKKIPSIIKVKTLRDLMDLILIRIYVEENVVRDNLGRVYIKDEKQNVDFQNNYIYKFKYIEKQIKDTYSREKKEKIQRENNENERLNNRYIFMLSDYKTSGSYGTIQVPFSKSITILIDKYIKTMQEHLDNNFEGKKLEFLFTKDNGDVYSNGLSRYITEMFRRHTGASDLGINALRHSVATYFKDQSDEDKLILAQKMHHTLETHKDYERHSGIIDKIPILDNLNNNDSFVGKRLYVIHNGKREEGIIEHSHARNRIDKPYKLTFVTNKRKKEPTIRYYKKIEIEELIKLYDTFKLVGTVVIYQDDKSSKSYTTVLEYNSKHRTDKSQPPYEIRIKTKPNKNRIIQISLPNPKITIA